MDDNDSCELLSEFLLSLHDRSKRLTILLPTIVVNCFLNFYYLCTIEVQLVEPCVGELL